MGQLFLFYNTLTVNPDVTDVFPSGSIEYVGGRVEDRLCCGAVKTDSAEVSLFARFQRADPLGQSQSTGAPQCCHIDECMGGKGAGVAAGALGEQAGQARFAEQIQAVIAGCAIGAKPDIDAGPLQGGCAGDAGGQLQVGGRAMGDLRIVPRRGRRCRHR